MIFIIINILEMKHISHKSKFMIFSCLVLNRAVFSEKKLFT